MEEGTRDDKGRFKKGISGNPKGKASGPSWSKLIQKHAETGIEGNTARERIISALLASAEAGEPWAIKEVLDRIDGRSVARQEIDHSTMGESMNAKVSFKGNITPLPEPKEKSTS